MGDRVDATMSATIGLYVMKTLIAEVMISNQVRIGTSLIANGLANFFTSSINVVVLDPEQCQ